MPLYYNKKIPSLVRGITSKHHGNVYHLNCLNWFRIENKGEYRKKVLENKNFRNFVMSPEDTKVLELNQYHKSDKTSFIFYTDL